MSYATPEGRVVKAILDYLNALPRCTARKVHGGPYAQAGEPDIDGVLDGRALKLEVKLPGTEAKIRRGVTPLQRAALLRYQRAGALAEVVTSVEEVQALVVRDALVPLPAVQEVAKACVLAELIRARVDGRT